MAVLHYPAIVEEAGENFLVSPGNFADALCERHYGEDDVMIEDRGTMPNPTTLNHLQADLKVAGYAGILVRAELPARAMRVSITMEKGLLAAADAVAQRQDMLRPVFLADVVRGMLRAERAG